MRPRCSARPRRSCFATGPGSSSSPGAGDPATHLSPADLGAAQWVNENSRPAGAGTEIFPGAGVACVPLTVGLVPLGVLVLFRPAPGVMDSEHRDFLEVFARQVAFAIERVRLAEEAKAATLRASSEAMRSSLLSAISHDLRSPLAAITGAGTALRDDRGGSARNSARSSWTRSASRPSGWSG